ncbi:MAG: hypothetical protein KJ614_00305 [Gammaproteobacteria bacterium]|nr:hypothetical protein [Rhodoferax sp.]MBU3897366.1 hypothetical protein [Gammaproteobacteria bacterium]MBU3999245.1 hypothetical protein [Gammaproteobacteria bacterium]MBU4018712.1 hypothetical protein [Gammaproteobacteria bacterium]MBU4079667.1 hypothetical protein [Gammaproteobacteria bacterium]
MFIIKTQKANSEMRRTIAIIVLALALGAALGLLAFKETGWTPTGVMVGAALGVSVVAGIVWAWIRNRQRRRLMDMQDSALW